MNSEASPLIAPDPPPPESTFTYHWDKFRDDYAILRTGPKALWTLYFIAFLYGFCFFLASIIILLYLTKVFDISDMEAGAVYGAMGLTFTIAAVLEGSIPDKFGIRVCFLIGGLVLALASAVLALAPNIFVALFAVLVIMPIGGGLSIPVTKVGVKKYTLPPQRSTAYSILYIAINGASAVASVLVDVVITSTGSIGGMSIYRWLLLVGAIVCLFSSVVAYFLEEMDYEETAENQPIRYHEKTDYWEMLERAASRYQFKILALVVLILIFVKAAYRQLDATFPRYMRREMGDDAHFGFVMAIHPIVLILSAVFFTPLAFKFAPYDIIIVGSTISSLSCFILLAGCTYLTCCLFVIGISIGEGMWNPRLYDYTLALSPKGMEGTFMALATVPLFLSMVLAGLMSGLLMMELCPDDGTRHCGIMWGIIGCVALLSPLGLLINRKRLKLDPKFVDMPNT